MDSSTGAVIWVVDAVVVAFVGVVVAYVWAVVPFVGAVVAYVWAVVPFVGAVVPFAVVFDWVRCVVGVIVVPFVAFAVEFFGVRYVVGIIVRSCCRNCC